jgi:hypothetical protein
MQVLEEIKCLMIFLPVGMGQEVKYFKNLGNLGRSIITYPGNRGQLDSSSGMHSPQVI